ncbi:class I SAM-dependent methyltransferase [Thalassotalea piscium]|uniref:Putative methyltransferase n=1 Tax=Thalassotalea piscium TaxID=1230533 RepID=A0A7X0NI20_9GAMM|nr:class I SAM-dependent methyltransferase [Thalassotalea piscium]MBB6543755.1 putative methyltransferase [Thalassotalea piscium]
MNSIKKILSVSVLSTTLLLTGCMTTDNSVELDNAISSNHRSAANKARDEFRHPKQTLEFFGFQPDMTVVELTPGGGWYTEILAPALKGSGNLYGAHYPDTGEDNYYSNSRKSLVKMLASNPIYSEVVLTDFVPKKESELAPKGTADLVLTFRNLHNWGEEGMQQMFKDAYTALKSGGVLGVVEHRMPASQSWKENMKSGYVPEALVIDYAKAAGFKLAASSDINANPKDTADHPRGVWTLPPSLALKEQDKEKYLAIGESDRMTLKFVK